MAEFERVPLRPRPSRNWLPSAGVALAVFLVVAIVKPWDLGPPATAGVATPLATFYVGPTERTGPRDYDPRLFGGREPDPAWELWPAGYVVQFGLAGPVRVYGQDGASPDPGETQAPSAGATDAPTGPPGSSRPAGSPLPENVVNLGPSDHLVALGINTPLDTRVEEVALWRLDGGGGPTNVPIVRLPTPWESTHFIVIAPEDPGAVGRPGPWEAGMYRLDLTTTAMEVREVLLVVHPPLD